MIFCLGSFPAGAGDEKSIEITVVQNDNVINICNHYLRDPFRWPEIARINRLKNRDLIYPGQHLLIPVRYLKGVPVSGRAVFVKGNVTVRNKSDAEWKTVHVHDVILEGQSLCTGPESVVEIVFEDGTSFLQCPETILDVNQTQRNVDASLWQRFILRSGQILLKVRRSLGGESRIEIQTPAGTAVARGTDFRVSTDAKQNMTSAVREGKIDVSAMKKTVALAAGEGTRVQKGEPPGKPRKLLDPPDFTDLQTLYRTLPVRLHFSNVEGAQSYRVWLSADAEGKNVVRETVVRRGAAALFTDLDDGVYHLHGQSIDNLGIEGFSSTPQKLILRVNPAPPFIQSPVDASEIKGKTVTWRWLTVSGAAHYVLNISRDRNFARDVFRTDINESSYQRVFQDFGTYYFRICSVAADGFESLWSDTLSFKLVPPPPAPSVEQTLVNDKELRIRWKDQGAKMTYRAQVAGDEKFSRVLMDRVCAAAEINFPRPSGSGVYYVRIKTIDSDGYEGDFSPPQHFEIKCDREHWIALGTYGFMAFLILLLP